MSMNVLYEINLPDGRCWTTTPIYEQAIEAAKAKAKSEGIPIEVAKHNLRTGQVRRYIYHPDGTVEKLWLPKKG